MWTVDRPPQWVGRGQELTVLRAGAEALRRGEGTVIWVEGEPGIGKSSLVAEALAAGSDPGFDIGWGIAGQLTERLPLRVMLDCLQVRPNSPDPRRAHAAEVLRGFRPGLFAGGDASVAGIELLTGLVDELSATTPAVIVLDDLQWADDASLIVWHQLADHAFSLTLDGQARTVEVLVRAFPPGAAAAPELALVRAGSDLVQGHLDEAAAHLAVATSYAGTTPPDRRRRLEMTIASLRLWLARRRAHLSGVVEQAGFLASAVTGRCGEEIALANDLRAVALMNLGTAEAWSLALTDAERHLRAGAALAREIGRPYLEVACLAQLGSPAGTGSLATARERCREAIALAERHGWGTEPVIAPALLTLAETTILTGEFGEGERWLRRAARALGADDAPGIRLRLHRVTGMLQAGRGRPREAVEEFGAAGRLLSQLASPLAFGSQVTGWTLATQARLGLTGEARAGLAALAGDQAGAGEVRNARAVICLADGDPAGALDAVREVVDGTAPVTGSGTVIEAQLLAGLARRALGDRRASDQSAERALALAEPDRLVLPFAMTGSRELLAALPRHQTAHAALLTDILDLLSGSSAPAGSRSSPPSAEQLSPGELRVLRYLPTNLSRPQIATDLSVSVNTVSTHIRNIYAKLGADDRSAAVHRARELRLLRVVT